MKKILFFMLVMALYTQMIDAQIWYYDEMRKTDKAESGQTEIGGEIVNIAFVFLVHWR